MQVGPVQTFVMAFAALTLAACATLAAPHSTPAAAASQPCAWPDALDAVVAAPQNHKVLLENDRVRVLDVTGRRVSQPRSDRT